MLTQERGERLTEFLKADEERAIKLLETVPEEAVKQINALGNDFTVDELLEYGSALKAEFGNAELSVDDLDDVAGGGWNWKGALKGALTGAVTGAGLGGPWAAVGGALIGGVVGGR